MTDGRTDRRQTRNIICPVFFFKLTYKKTFSRTKKALRLNLGKLHRGLRIYQVCSNDDPRLSFDLFMARSNLRLCVFVWAIYMYKIVIFRGLLR